MSLLSHHVPITLLADLLDPAGPDSREIYRVEAVADDVRRELAALAAAEASVDLTDGARFTARQAAG